jgi:hypothetical protein
MKPEYLHCFNCEIEMQVKEDKKGQLSCSNCGLIHLSATMIQEEKPFHLINEIHNNFYQNLARKFDDLLVEGLKRKGFKFENKSEIEDFIKTRCECKDNVKLQERVYYVDNIPFFLHNYKIQITEQPLTKERPFTLTANCGSYSFL